MPYTHTYTGDVPTAFINITGPEGHTWVPSTGDSVVLDDPHPHPFLVITPVETEVLKPTKTTKTPEGDDTSSKDDGSKEQ